MLIMRPETLKQIEYMLCEDMTPEYITYMMLCNDMASETFKQMLQIVSTLLSELKERKKHTQLYLKTTHTNDLENVHDTTVNQCLRNILKYIETQNVKPFENVYKEIMNIVPQNKKYNVKKALQGLSPQNTSCALKTSDQRALQLVWARASHPQNAKNADNIKEAIYLALEDMNTEISLVCVHGRISRLLGALVLLDFNPNIWTLETMEDIKNNIFGKAIKLISNFAQVRSNNTDPDIQNIAQSYLGKTSNNFSNGPGYAAKERLYMSKLEEKLKEMVNTEIKNYNEKGITVQKDFIDVLKNQVVAAI